LKVEFVYAMNRIIFQAVEPGSARYSMPAAVTGASSAEWVIALFAPPAGWAHHNRCNPIISFKTNME
jgi:hypothetical protein